MDLLAGLSKQPLFDQMGVTVIAFALVLVRCLAFFHFAPVFSHKSIPSHVRIALSLLLTIMLTSKAFETSVPTDGYSLTFAIFCNFALGFLMGFVANLMFITVVAGGEMMDSSMGFSAAQTFDPSIGTQTTILGKFMSMLTIVVFFFVQGPELLIKGLSNSIDSFNIYNPNLALNVDRMIHLTGDIITMGFILVSPVVITILVNDLVLGLVSRAAPQINAFQISFTVKPVIGLFIWMLILPLFFTGLVNFFMTPSRLF